MSKKDINFGSGNRDLDLRIWNIRDLIQTLEDTKDEIIAFLTDGAELDDTTQKFWVIDAKEAYFSIVAAWEMLHGVSRGQSKYIPTTKAYLGIAKSRLAQCTSELTALSDEGAQLSSKYTSAFESCWNAINTELKGLMPEENPVPPSKKVVKVSDNEYDLLCSICGKVATWFWVGIPESSEKKVFICSGLVHRAAISLSAVKQIFLWLDKDDIAAVHTYLEKNTVVFEEGLDAYCPQCDKIYCADHMDTREEWDEGFYDCTYGTCPEAHTRIIHD